MTRAKKERTVGVDPADYPGLREFFSGYLHEDFRDEYGSAAGAARAFCGDASAEEASQARQEWAKLRRLLTGQSIPDLHTGLQKLGGAWQPLDLEELKTVDAIFATKPQDRPN